MPTDFLSQLQRVVGASYDIERELLGGGMSRVFVATERALARKVVIKVLPPELAAGVNIERFKREIQLAAQLHHPHIVPLLSTGEGEGVLYYTMPYIEGESLRGVLERSGRLPVSDVVRVLHDVVDALAYAHGRGVVHRDIKPANILRLGSHALVTDFGVAKALSAAIPMSGVTTAGFAIGTPAYMAPEQLAGDPAADHRLDLYAVGLLAYELLTGASPFSSLSPQATLTAQLTQTPEPLHTVRPEVPQALSDLIMRCLETQPENRPATADSLQAELDEVSTPRGAVLAADGASLGRGRPTAARGALVGAGVVVLLSAAAYAVVVSRAGDDSGSTGRATVAAGGAPVDTSVLTTPAPQPVGLSRADSLAIADAVNSRMEAQRVADGARTQAMVDSSVRAVLEHALDSVGMRIAEFRTRANAAPETQTSRSRGEGPRAEPVLPPPQPGERRVVVLPFSPNIGRQSEGSGGRNRLRGFGDNLADSLRIALQAGGGFVVVPESTTRSVYGRADSVPTIARFMLRAPVIVTGEYAPRGRDSMHVRAQIECSGCGRKVREATVRASRPTAAVTILLDSLLSDLARVQQWTWPTRGVGGARGQPGQPPPDGRRGGPSDFPRGPRTPPAPPATPPPPA